MDVRCHRHDKRMLLLWVDVRAPATVYARVPGAGQLPDASGTRPVACPRGCRDDVDLDQLAARLRDRIPTFGPHTTVWPACWPVTVDGQ
jgi:hypothetical protein